MTEKTFTHESSDIIGEACAWIAQLETGDMSAADMQAFQEWIQRSPAHFQEMKRLAKLSADANILTDMSGSMNQATKERRLAIRDRGYGGRYLRPAFATLAVLSLFMVGSFGVYKASHVKDSFMVATAVGGFEEITLPDGSHVKLNTASQIEVDFDKKQRRIRLLKGEAFFDVAHNPSRPFIVFADDKTVRAVGTAFAVRWTDGDLSVTVSEGKVQFAPLTEHIVPMSVKIDGDIDQKIDVASLEAPVLLTAGQKLSLPNERNTKFVASVTDSHVQSDLAWKSGLWDFEDTPLVEVINEMNRYTDMKIEFAETELSGVHFDGLFRTDDLEGLLEGLDLLDDIDIVRVDNGHVRIEYVQN